MRILWLSVAAVTILGCNKQKVADTVEPVDVELTMQTDGLWQDVAGVRVDGTAKGMEEVLVNGIAVDAADGDYTATVQAERGVNVIEAVGHDARGDTYFVRQGVLAGEFRNPDQIVDEALTIRVNRSGLTKATELVGGLIDPVAINSTVTALNPVYNDSYGVLGWDAVTVQADLVNIGFSAPIITPDPRPGVMAITVDIPNVEVQAAITGDVVSIDFDQDAWIGCDNAVITANILVDVQNGDLVLDLIAPAVSLDGFWYDVSLIPDEIESFVLVDTLRGVVENMLVTQMDEMLPDLLAGALGDLDISFETELLGTQVAISAEFASASIDASGLSLTTDVNVVVPPALEKPWVGYLGSPSSTPDPTLADDLGLSVKDDLLNNVFFQVWRGGILALDLDSEAGDIDAVLLSQLGATDSARVVVDADLPPVIIEKNGEAQIQLTELQVRIETPNGEKGEYIDLAVTAWVDLQLQIVDGNLTLDLGTPDVQLDVRDSDWGIDNNTVTALLADQLPISTLLLLLGDIEFPLPSVAGISVDNGDAFRESSGVYTSVGINL